MSEMTKFLPPFKPLVNRRSLKFPCCAKLFCFEINCKTKNTPTSEQFQNPIDNFLEKGKIDTALTHIS